MGRRRGPTKIVEEGKPEKEWLRVRDGAHITSLSVSRIYELIQAGEIESVRIGRSVRIPAHALREFMRRQGPA